MKESELTALFAILRSAYPGATVTEKTIPLYQTMLADLDTLEVRRAVYEHIATSNWFPTVSQLRTRVARHQVLAPSEAEALHQVVTKHRPLHPLVKEAFELTGGTWEYNRTDNQTAWRAQFRDTYNSLVEVAVHDANVKPVLKRLGVANPPPKMEIAK